MTRSKWLISLALLGCSGLWAQSSTVTIGTSPEGAQFLVDGTAYYRSQVFIWPTGSKHILQFAFTQDAQGNNLAYQQSVDGSVRFTFGGWVATGGTLDGATGPNVTVTAGPISSVIATLSVLYKVHIQFPSTNNSASATCSGAPNNPSTTSNQFGIVYVSGACYANTTDQWVAAGQVALSAYPFPGYAFGGWVVNNLNLSAANTSFTMTGATNITPVFLPAKRVHFMTNPAGLQVLVDHTPVTTPLIPSSNGATCTTTQNTLPPSPPAGSPALCVGDVDFLPNTVHTLGATTPQQDQINNYWVFEGFSNGLGQNATYIAPTTINYADTITANFSPGVRVTFTTSQPGLQLIIDGRSNWQGYNFVWGQGETHTISAPATQVDSNGRTWNFTGWSNGGATTQTITVPSNTTNYALTATFKLLPQVTINSSPTGLQFSIDGQSCATPCTVSRASGSTMQVTIPASIASSNVSRFDLTSWSDGGTATTRTVAFNQDTLSLTATYHASWALQTAANPSGGGVFTYNPPSPDGFFADGTQVTVTVAAKPGYKFLKWDGDIAGNFTTGYIMMSGPHSATGYFQTVPFIPSAGIMSAAGATPDGTVAPGSIISIYGNNLAPAFQTGGTNPLPQALGNITVTIGNYVLPLMFVSPGQINAQLPAELTDGNYTLVVHQVGQPDVPGTLTVSRDAPAVFTQANDQNQPLVLALHQDGTLVTFANPAIHGETISIYGTGFGPYDTTLVDGFFVPATPQVNVVDPVSLTIGPITKAPDWTGAAPGMVGMTIMQLTITDDIPSATTLNLTVTVNTKPSTQVVLPLQ